MHFQCMSYTTLTVRHEVAKRLKGVRSAGESYSDVITRLMDNQPAKCAEEWLASLAPMEGRSLFTPEEREQLVKDQRTTRDSRSRRKPHASA